MIRRFATLLRSYRHLVEPALRSSRRAFVVMMSFQVAYALCQAFYPYGLRLFVDGALHHSAVELEVSGGLVALLWVTNWVVSFLASVSSGEVTQRADAWLAARIAQLVNAAPTLEHFERPEYLRELDLLSRDRQLLASSGQQISNIAYTFVRTIVMLVLLATVSPIFLLLPIVAILPGFANAYAARIRKRNDDEVVEEIRLANELFQLTATAAPAKELRIYGLNEELLARHDALAKDIVRRSSIAVAKGSLAEGAVWGLFGLAFISVIALTVLGAVHNHLSPGSVMMVVMLALSFQSQLSRVTGGTGTLNRARKTAERLVWLEDQTKSYSESSEGEDPPDRIVSQIAFDNVSFAYPGGGGPVLKDLSFALPAGSSVALVGENGAGKTTLVKLLLRLYDPTSGTITLDGRPIGDFDRARWRDEATATFQDFVRFELLCRETVGIGDLDHLEDDAAVLAALERSGGSDVLGQLGEEPLASQLGSSFPTGRDLSGGQWQKLALARGQMREFPLLVVLDEPTASLDAATEHLIYERHVGASAQAARSRGAITILVSHRFSTVRMANRILVLHEGELVEQGTHEELMALGGRYAELFVLQERAYRGTDKSFEATEAGTD